MGKWNDESYDCVLHLEQNSRNGEFLWNRHATVQGNLFG